jgi:hypothetical protein
VSGLFIGGKGAKERLKIEKGKIRAKDGGKSGFLGQKAGNRAEIRIFEHKLERYVKKDIM